MNDIVLSGLLNLFALFGACFGIDREKSIPRISSYLTKFYGIRNLKSYIRLYVDLREYYDDFPDLDRDSVIDGICANLKGKMRPVEGLAFVIRMLEFCAWENGAFKPDHVMFRKLSDCFSLSDGVYGSCVDFIEGTGTDAVRIKVLDGDCGSIKTLYVREMDVLFFSYIGHNSLWMDDIQIMPGVFQIWNKSSLLKSSHFQPIYHSSIMSLYSGDSGKDAIELCGRDINFRFDKGGDNGMHNLSFTLHSGELVAIMGGSGVGKSTLLSLLNGNLTPQEGMVTINGHSIEEPRAKALIGFVPQDDLLIEELTVYQNLWYTAKLCFDRMPDEEIDRKVMATLTDLGLDAARDLKVGSPINKFISGGQRKRLNIALELIREPSILYLDEPTSGLSSTDTEKVINILKELTQKGKLIVVNIHQPSSDVYKLFDRLWLLDKGGYPIYDGNPIEAISRFKTLANYADSRTSACPVCGNVNPEIVLNIVDDKMFDTAGTLSDKRKVTPQEWHEMYLKERPEMDAPSVSEVPHTDQRRPGILRQLLIFLKRNLSAKITNLQYVLVTLLEAPLLAVICAFLTRFTPVGGSYTLMDNKNFPSYIFMAIIVSIFLGMSGSAEEIIKDRALLKREKFLRLSYGAYISSKVVYMAAVCLVQTLLFILVGNFIIGVSGMFWYWWLILFVSAFLSSLIGLLLSQFMNSIVSIYITIPLLLIPQILLCGLVVKFDDLNPKSETGVVPLVGELIPSRWSYEALAVASYSMNDFEREFYDRDRERFEAMYYLHSFAYELEASNENRREAVLKAELPRLADFCGMEPYEGDWSYGSIDDYIARAKDILSKRCSAATLALDREMNAIIRDRGKEEMLAAKKKSVNNQLENLVVNRNTESVYNVVGKRIVPRSGYIYLTPRLANGRAPFYSGVKRLGDSLVPTYWFDLCVLLLMCVALGACLYLDFPGRFVRKERN